jgi:hypothetical protein
MTGRIRSVKPEFFVHEGLYEAEQASGLPLRLAFIGLWGQCDREGRFLWRPRVLKLSVMPYDAVDFAAVLDALAAGGWVERYGDAGEFGFVPTWERHQLINNREQASRLPPPFDACPTRAPRVSDASATRAPRVPHAPSGELEGKPSTRAPRDEHAPSGELELEGELELDREEELFQRVCDPVVVDPASAREHTHTHEVEDLVGRFGRVLSAMRDNPPVAPAPPPPVVIPPPRPADDWGWGAVVEKPAPPPPAPLAPGDPWACGWTPADEPTPGPSPWDDRDAPTAPPEDLAATTWPELEAMVLERTRGRRGCVLPAVSIQTLRGLVDRYGMARVVSELLGIVEPVDSPVSMLTKRLERRADEKPRAPNGNRW